MDGLGRAFVHLFWIQPWIGAARLIALAAAVFCLGGLVGAAAEAVRAFPLDTSRMGVAKRRLFIAGQWKDGSEAGAVLFGVGVGTIYGTGLGAFVAIAGLCVSLFIVRLFWFYPARRAVYRLEEEARSRPPPKIVAPTGLVPASTAATSPPKVVVTLGEKERRHGSR